MERTIPVALSARHAHLCQADVEALFGPGYQLTRWADLSQPGQFAARETVEVVGPRRSIPGVRLLGPPRGRSQVELSLTDGVALGLSLPVRMSGEVAGTPGCHLIGPRGAVKLREGCIAAMRHVHATPEDARRLGIADGQMVYVRLAGARGLVLREVAVRVSDQFHTELHLDTDEGNGAGIRSGDRVEVIPSLCADLCDHGGCAITPGVDQGRTRPYCDLTTERITIR